MSDNLTRSCIDCAVTNCDKQDKTYPAFCLTTNNKNEKVLQEALELYKEEENHEVMINAADVEAEFYGMMTRVEEIVEFSKRMGFKKLGIATCVGLINESRILAKILRKNGFEVFGAACKAGAVEKTAVGIKESCEKVGKNMCNPIYQAKRLNAENTEFNIVMGLCVGHDSLFYKHSDALVTTLVTKDRVLGHNPAAALYTANSYYRKLLEE
ncbi:DUF1847 domain-containing protein [Bariatricus massiliensis]|uniref:DUF1847 domain-containing protein n=1 Tax=Bariatricus massiliensis TaxID=1745713 RepID=A0ABS8DCA6_9FIRM|nr:DUF1847 domain-containing protein [Bariatricus massiliensis]MCB7303252.1 DUF1847 domain-containing protein [Bariatricus massiliensis]MCB7373384.1 DUF1847 domain-containing protein [Bariatricus massiliensis]MCB7386054.1 DUF1847 domain-containing protein [Bariatricus massiliensis]MCB7410216.1 DUF1847 domain-containing protein [Bariatricus massiliensis]MCQ5252500.1 DUF1847 domain-containing protein [Bariatricus massiliensis]